ncbi:MAG: hypothetical protein KBT21_08095 [Treponema sp.]|nr:hypothetical protein [Candidatus Treponema merdequi]
MADKNNIRLFRGILAAGFLCVMIGISLIIALPAKKTAGFLVVFFIVLMFLSASVIYFSLIIKKAVLLYIGLNLLIFSIVSEVMVTRLIPLEFTNIWPIVMVSCGLTLIPCGYLKFERLRTIYLIPAAALIFLGTVFILFAYHIIKIPFRRFVAYMWPVILICSGIFLIAYYLYSQKNTSAIMQDSDDGEIR